MDEFQVDRKLVKQTVMTSVYGVTYIGARDQIKRRLKERNAITDDSEVFRAACYAAKVREYCNHEFLMCGPKFPLAVFLHTWRIIILIKGRKKEEKCPHGG